MESHALNGHFVIVTGAGRGIGRAIARACGREGAHVGLGHHTSTEAAQALKEEIDSDPPGSAELLCFDVASPEAIRNAFSDFFERNGRLDGLVSNAALHVAGLLLSQEDAPIRAQVETNLLGPIYCAREAVRLMLPQHRGVIVQVGSVAAQRPFRGQSVYAATKGGVESLTRALAVEYGRKGIRAHTVVPGPIDTDMLSGAAQVAPDMLRSRIPMGKPGTPDDIAELVVFLLSDRARFMNGGSVPVDGGYLVG